MCTSDFVLLTQTPHLTNTIDAGAGQTAGTDDVFGAPIETFGPLDDAAQPHAPPAWQRWLSLGVSVVTAACLVWQMHKIGWAPLRAALPANPLFYILTAALYLLLPLTETVIYHRLWALPFSSVRLFLRKRVLNEAVFGYSGEAYIFLWARRQTGLAARAMGAVKDVNITSALASNGLTVMLVGVMLAFGDQLAIGGLFTPLQLKSIVWGAVLLTLPGFVILLFSKHLMSLSRAENVRLFAIHMARMLVWMALLMLSWHAALPAVAWNVWIILTTLRLVVTRVPFAPNTDLLFATVGLGLAANASSDASTGIAALLALSAALPLVGHALVLLADWLVPVVSVRGVAAQ